MIFNFNEKLENFLKIITKSAQNQNLRVFFVGGIVRDNILNIPNDDIDIIVEGNAIDFAKSLPDIIQINSIHEDFATVKVSYFNYEIDIASTRIENYPYSGCLPVVSKVGVSIEDDVKRRDFSVNSLYCELKFHANNLTYDLIDLVSGVDDIKNKTLRVLHSKSFIDDPTRILRGLNFKYRLGFDFSSDDLLLIEKYMNNIQYENASSDRILSVFKHTLNNQYAPFIFKEIIENKYYKILQKKDISLDLNFVEYIIEIFKLDAMGRLCFYLSILKDDNIEKQSFKSNIDIVKFFDKLTIYDLAFYYFKTSDNSVFLYKDLKNIKLILTGNDLINVGYKQGKELGLILAELLESKYKNNKLLSSFEDELNWVLKNFPIK